jgi:hypothetical protein
MLAFARRAAIAALCSTALQAQLVVCPGSVTVPYFGWDATDCGQCNVYGSYLEYLTPPQIRDIKPSGPAANQLRDNDVLLAVDGLGITTPAAWHRMRDVRPGEAVRFSVRRGADTVMATVAPSERCAAPSDPRIPRVGSSPDLRTMPPTRSLVVGGATVEISGTPDTVTRDPRTGEAIIVAGGVVVRIKPRSP